VGHTYRSCCDGFTSGCSKPRFRFGSINGHSTICRQLHQFIANCATVYLIMLHVVVDRWVNRRSATWSPLHGCRLPNELSMNYVGLHSIIDAYRVMRHVTLMSLITWHWALRRSKERLAICWHSHSGSAENSAIVWRQICLSSDLSWIRVLTSSGVLVAFFAYAALNLSFLQ